MKDITAHIEKFVKTHGGLNLDDFYEKHKGKPFFSDLNTYMQSDVVTGMELVAENAIENFRNILGPTDAAQAK